MKTLKLSMYATILCLLSMGMGFPDMIIDKELPTVKKQASTSKVRKPATVSCSSVACCTKTDRGTQTRQNRQKQNLLVCPSSQAAASIKNIYLKLFDKNGNLLLTENLRIEEFLNTDYSALNLPAGSTFVMFHDNTAYYYIDSTYYN